MIASSSKVAGLSLACAVAAHLLALASVGGPEAAEIEGRSGGADVALGTGFADLVAGATSSPPVAHRTETVQPDRPVETTRAEPARRVAPAAETPAPEHPAALAPVKPAPGEPVLAIDTRLPEPAEPAKTAAPDTAPPTEPRTPTDVTAASAPSGAVSRSPRPAPRSAEFETAHAQVRPQTTPRETPRQTATSTGNAEVVSRRGDASGQIGGSSATSGASGRSQDAGNASASNYPGEVMRRIQRVRQPDGRFSGQALVSFRIGPSGALVAAGIARSSGSAQLDRAAVRVVQSAAPFPAPPPGAQTSYSVQIAGR